MYQNKVTLIGFLGNDAEVRTNDNRSFTTLSLATKSSYKKDGKYIAHTEWHRCVVFGKLARVRRHAQEGRSHPGRRRDAQPGVRQHEDRPERSISEIRVDSILKLDRAEPRPARKTTRPGMSRRTSPPRKWPLRPLPHHTRKPG